MTTARPCAGAVRGCTSSVQGHPNRKWCSERCRKAQYDVPCIDCGTRCNGTTPSRHGGRCTACDHARHTKWTRDTILAALRAWADQHEGESPSADDWRTNGDGREPHPPTATVQALFVTWNAAIAAAGLSTRKVGQRRWPSRTGAAA